jgi:outer membrane protein assembly factor BamB
VDWTKPELFAYDATTLANIYSSTQFSAVGGHFITPMVVDGKVYFGTGSSIVVFGLLK